MQARAALLIMGILGEEVVVSSITISLWIGPLVEMMEVLAGNDGDC